jgi:hypothetical protein
VQIGPVLGSMLRLNNFVENWGKICILLKLSKYFFFAKILPHRYIVF